MRKHVLICMLIPALHCALSPASGGLFGDPPLQRVLEADLVVVGELVDVRKDAIQIISRGGNDAAEQTRNLSTGTIKIREVVKARRWGPRNPAQSKVNFAFFSEGQSGETATGRHLTEGRQAIWFLRGSYFTRRYSLIHPEGILPLDSLSVVRAQVERMAAILKETMVYYPIEP